MVLLRCRYYSYQPSDDSDIRELEKWEFVSYRKVKNGVIEDTL